MSNTGEFRRAPSELEWIAGMGVDSDAYKEAYRYGRHHPLNDTQRQRAWEVYTKYRALRDAHYDYDWYDLARCCTRGALSRKD